MVRCGFHRSSLKRWDAEVGRTGNLADLAGTPLGADQFEVEIARLRLDAAQAEVVEDFTHGARAPLSIVIEKLNARRSDIPAVTHVDYSARVQTVHKETNPLYHALLTRFHEKTGCPVLVNTSFNVRGEPVVCAPEDAFRCFMGTEIETLAVGNCFLRKEEQTQSLKRTYKDAFTPD